MILLVVNTYKDITLILTLYSLRPPVWSIFRHYCLLREKIVAENIMS